MRFVMKVIEGYEDYSIDEDGNVYSMKSGELKKLKPTKNSCGYLQVALSKNGKVKIFKVHRLVYKTFIKDILKDMEIDHIDKDKTNNKLNNLRLVTHQQNNFNRNAKGYSWNKRLKKWMAYIKLNAKYIHLGFFDIEAEASAAYLAAKEKLHIIPST